MEDLIDPNQGTRHILWGLEKSHIGPWLGERLQRRIGTQIWKRCGD
jgi:hypothetical protein